MIATANVSVKSNRAFSLSNRLRMKSCLRSRKIMRLNWKTWRMPENEWLQSLRIAMSNRFRNWRKNLMNASQRLKQMLIRSEQNLHRASENRNNSQMYWAKERWRLKSWMERSVSFRLRGRDLERESRDSEISAVSLRREFLNKHS